MLDVLTIFVTVVEQKNFSKAAKLLNLSQPNVSLHIKNLEAELDTVLFYRSPKYVKVTEEGEIFYLHAKKILSLLQAAKEQINDRKKTVQGKLTIGASFTIGEYILPQILAEYAKENPLVKVEVTVGNTAEVINKVRNNELEIGLIEGEVTNDELQVKHFMEDEMIIIAPANHPLAQLELVDIDALQDQVWILRESGSGTRAYSDHYIETSKLKMAHFFIFSSSQGIKEAVSAGLGIAMISKWTVQRELKSGEIKQLRIRGRRLFRNFSIIQSMNEQHHSKAHQLFFLKIKNFHPPYK